VTAPTPNAALAYKVSFTRIGRQHDVAPLVVEADGPNHLAKLIFDYARPKLGSRDIDVSLEENMGSGWIFAGVRTAGTFTIEAVEILDPRPDGDRTWRECAHRADYASAAEHERNCPFHLGEVDENGLPNVGSAP
jgi:hypothetical protein